MGELDEIDNFSAGDAVEEVANGPAKHESKCDPDRGLRKIWAKEVHDDEGDAGKARDREQGGCVLEQAEGCARIRVVHESNWPIRGRPGLPPRQGRSHGGLRELVDGDDGRDEHEQPGVGSSETANKTGLWQRDRRRFLGRHTFMVPEWQRRRDK